jgi:hypothetical protein
MLILWRRPPELGPVVVGCRREENLVAGRICGSAGLAAGLTGVHLLADSTPVLWGGTRLCAGEPAARQPSVTDDRARPERGNA